MNKLLMILLVFVLLFAGSVGAQEGTPDAPVIIDVEEVAPPVIVVDTTVYSVALIVVGVIFLIGFGVLGYVVRPAILQLGISAPEWALKGVQSGYESGMEKLNEFVLSTDTPLDDAAAAEIHERIDELFGEIERLRKGGAPGDSTG